VDDRVSGKADAAEHDAVSVSIATSLVPGVYGLKKIVQRDEPHEEFSDRWEKGRRIYWDPSGDSTWGIHAIKRAARGTAQPQRSRMA